MHRAARIVGIVWMAGCFALWLWVGLIWDWSPYDALPWLPDWTRIFGLNDIKLGLTAAPIALGVVGYGIYSWGGKSDPAS